MSTMLLQCQVGNSYSNSCAYEESAVVCLGDLKLGSCIRSPVTARRSWWSAHGQGTFPSLVLFCLIARDCELLQ